MVVDKKVLASCKVAACIYSFVGISSARHMDAPCKWDARFLLTSVEGVVELGIIPPIIHCVNAVLDASGIE
jgi:hypothetical protein